ncbi:hypothetical protein [Pseudonocardia sp. ICBG1142]|uniref:hypothetical protein n=1 Tax=Pseudonocardia sp. ICBG1142 TaxID=2846760 RepID=UPI001CF68042|nr:hypothetical protein [Pseudonocardia sp. ICBG1142]
MVVAPVGRFTAQPRSKMCVFLRKTRAGAPGGLLLLLLLLLGAVPLALGRRPGGGDTPV